METTTSRNRLMEDPSGSSRLVSTKPMSICLFGDPYWSGRLAENLNTFGKSPVSARWLPLNSWRFFAGLRKALTADLIVSIGFRPGARTLRGRAFDAVWSTLRVLNPRAARVFYWIGTDVLNTMNDLRDGKLRRRCFAKAQLDHHLATAPRLADALKAMGITALTKTFALQHMAVGPAPELPARFSVLSYIPDSRYRFYGGECLYQVARRLPEIHFDVIDGSGTWVTDPLPNLMFHGWQKDMQRFYRDATVVLRLVEHDGWGGTVIEGLSFGRHVIYSLPAPHTIPVAWADSDAVVDALRSLFALHQTGSLPLNTAGQAYVREHFNFDRYMEDLMSYFAEVAAGGSGREEDRHGR